MTIFGTLHGRVIRVDERDADLGQFRWGLSSKGYPRRCTPRTEYLHRIIAKRMLPDLRPTDQVHHGPGGKLDARRSNLIICRSAQAHKSQHFEYPGLRWDGQRSKWLVRPTLNGVKTFLGRYDDFETALKVWEEATR